MINRILDAIETVEDWITIGVLFCVMLFLCTFGFQEWPDLND